MDWKDGRISYLRIKSKLGGNCRLRVHNALSAKGKVALQPARGENPNAFYAVADIQKPLVSEKAALSGPRVEKGNLYDFQTEAGKVYEFGRK